jgi:eukaryotic-like serine/threonine-protein kinase
MSELTPHDHGRIGVGAAHTEATVTSKVSTGEPSPRGATRADDARLIREELEPSATAESPTGQLDTEAAALDSNPEPVRSTRAIPAIPGYEILGVLGRGSMGIVYHARQVSLNRPCALKMILAGAHADASAFLRFRGEAEAIARLQHPNIVQIHSIGEVDGLPFFEIEYVSGGSLDKAIDGTPWPARRAAALVEPLARAIAEAHRLGLIHRDLKPGNVLLAADGTPKITDFGLAKSLNLDSGLTGTEAILGTPSYMAPEQAEGKAKQVGPLADVYALGTILYELLSGRPPFKGTTIAETLELVKSVEAVPPSRFVPGLPRDLETIGLKCLNKEPAKRYASAEAMAEDLRRYQSGQPILARRTGLGERSWRWCRRNPMLAGAVGAAAAALVAVAVVSTLYAADRTRYATRLAQEGGRTKAALSELNQHFALLALERGRNACDQGEISSGLLWMVEGLDYATKEHDEALQHAARADLALMQPQLPTLRAVFSHHAPVTAAFSRDGKTILTGSLDKTVRLWDAVTGQPRGSLMELEVPIWAVAFSPDGKTILTGSRNGTAQLWDAVLGQRRGKPMEHPDEVLAVAFSPDGETILTGCRDRISRLWDTATGKLRAQTALLQAAILAVAFSPDGRTLLTGSTNQTAQLWDTATAQPIGPPLPHKGYVFAVAFSPDNKKVLTGSSDKTAQIWEVATGRPLGNPLLHQDGVRAGAFSPDGKTVLTGGYDKTARLWDVATGRPHGRPMEHQSTVGSVAFSPDGKMILTGSYDTTARLWDSSSQLTGGSGRRFEGSVLATHEGAVTSVGFSPNGKIIATASSDKVLQLWDASSLSPFGKPVVHESRVLSASFGPEGKTILTVWGPRTPRRLSAGLWDTATGQPCGAVIGGKTEIVAALSPDGHSILTGSRDGSAQLWDAVTGQPLGAPMNHQSGIRALAFSPDGKTLLIGCLESHACLWDAATRHLRGKPLEHQAGIWAVAFSPDGRTALTAGEDGNVWLWDTATGTARNKPLAHHNRVQAVAFSPDSKMILTGSLDFTARLWDVATASALGTPMVHQDAVQSVAFSPDGKTALTGSSDRTARLWSIPGPLEGDVDRVRLWIQALTDGELDSQGDFHVLDSETWRERSDRLEQLGGPPGS